MEQEKKSRKNIFLSFTVIILGILILLIISFPSGSSSTKKAIDARVQADMVQIRASSNIYYEKFGNFDDFSCATAMEGKIDMNSLCDDIEKNSGYKPVFLISGDKYCAVARLKSKMSYHCVDSSYSSIQGSCDSKNFTCSENIDGGIIFSEAAKANQAQKRNILIYKIVSIVIIGLFIVAWLILLKKDKKSAIYLLIVFLLLSFFAVTLGASLK